MSLMNGQMQYNTVGEIPAKSCSLDCDQGSQGSTPFNYRLPSSTPALSPQRPGTPSVYQPSAPFDCYNQSVPQGGAPLPVVSNAASTVTPLQPVPSTSTAMSYVPASGPSNLLPTGYLQPALQTETLTRPLNLDQQLLKDSDMLWHIQAQLTQLQQHNAESQRVFQKRVMHIPVESDYPKDDESSGDEQSEGTSGEENYVNEPELAPVRDTSCQTSFDKPDVKAKKNSPQRTSEKVNTVRYLMGEIKALVADQGDTEVQRLLAELEESVSLLPVIVGSTNIHAEIALALQPLRSENAQLRRRLRILNQQLRERERAEKESRPPDINLELISLQSMNITLQNQLSLSQKSLEFLQGKNEELLKVMNDQKEENKKVGKTIHEREQELFQSKQQAQIEAAKFKIEVEETLAKMKSIQFKLEASEKENNILGITLRQRDAEVHRLRELTRTLQGSMAKLVSDLGADNLRSKPGTILTTSALKAYERQLQSDNSPASTSIMSYLKKLETNNGLDNAESAFSGQTGALKSSDGSVYENQTAPDETLKKSTVAEDPAKFHENSAFLSDRLSPISSRLPSKPNANIKSDDGTFIDEEDKLDETMYIPFASSPSKTRLTVPERRICSPLRIPSRSLDYNNRTSELENNKHTGESNPLPGRSECPEFTGDFGFKTKVHSTAGMKDSSTKIEQWLPAKPREKIKELSPKCPYSVLPCQPAKDPQLMNSMSSSSFSTIDFRPGKTDWSTSSFSTFTSHDEQDFRDGLADLDANIARLQRTLQANFPKKLT